jgi:hypothetical protein
MLKPCGSGLFEAVYVFLEKQHTIFMTFAPVKKLFVLDWAVKVDFFGFDVRLRVCKNEIDLPCPQVFRDG